MRWLQENSALLRDRVAAEVSKVKNRAFMDAVVSGCALVAAADGSIDATEKQKMIGFIQRSSELKHFDMSEIIEKFQDTVGDFEFDFAIGKGMALKTIAKVKGNEEQARLLVRLFCAIGAADGNFDDKERAAVSEIAQELGLNPSDFDL